MIWLYTLLFAFILYAEALSFIPMINYWDEVVAIVIIVLYLVRIGKKGTFKLNKYRLENYLLIFFVFVMGIVGNLAHPGIQNFSEAICKDMVAFFKFPLLMTMLMDVNNTWYYRHRDQILKKISVVCRITIMAAATLAVIGYIVDIGVYTDEVRYIKCYQFVFSHPTFLVANLVFCVAMLMMEGRRKNKWYILISCVLLFLTQRFKAYAIIALIVLMVFIKENTINKMFSFNQKTKIKAKYVIPVIAVMGIIFYFVFRNRFATYISWGMTSARLAMIVVCGRIAIDFFPFGSGFGTFASYLSGRFYSGIYSMYGISNVAGLRISEYNYISDTFWPWVVGQFGAIAAIAYIRLFYKFVKLQFVGIKNTDKLRAFIILWSYALLASMMEAFFTNSTGVALAVILTIYVGKDATISLRNIMPTRKG